MAVFCRCSVAASGPRTWPPGLRWLRFRKPIAWRDVPEGFGPWQTIWKRHRRFSGDGTWDAILTALLGEADSRGLIDWEVSVDSTINRAHQYATNLPRPTGGPDELQETGSGAA